MLLVSKVISIFTYKSTILIYFSGIHLGLPLTLAIAMHNIPEGLLYSCVQVRLISSVGLAVAAPIYFATGRYFIDVDMGTINNIK